MNRTMNSGRQAANMPESAKEANAPATIAEKGYDSTSIVGLATAEYEYQELDELQIEQRVAELLEHGYCIVPASIPTELFAQLRSACAPLANTAYGNLMARHPAFCDLCTAPNLLRIARRICGDDCLVSSYSLSSPPADTPEQEYHTDDLLYGRELFPRPLDHYLNINTITALNDFSAGASARPPTSLSRTCCGADRCAGAENGATKIVPGKTQSLG